MAKKVHSYSLKGVFNFKNMTIGESDKKTGVTTYYSVKDILSGFDGKTISFLVKEEDEIPSIDSEEIGE